MKIGDLVRDDSGNVGVIVGDGECPPIARFFLVQFPSVVGYNKSISWVYERDLEVVSEGRNSRQPSLA